MDYVKLNVGGSLFYSTRSTLTKQDTMLRAMFSGRIPVSLSFRRQLRNRLGYNGFGRMGSDRSQRQTLRNHLGFLSGRFGSPARMPIRSGTNSPRSSLLFGPGKGYHDQSE